MHHLVMPRLAARAQLRRQPCDANWRYSRQIMSHLLAEGERIAREWSGNVEEKPEWLVLMVHRDNARAI